VRNLGWLDVDLNTERFSWRREMRNIFYNRSSFDNTKFEDKSIDDGFKNLAVFDSFTGGVHLPVTEWNPLMRMLAKDHKEKFNVNLKCDNTTKFRCWHEGNCKNEMWATFGFNFIGDRAYVLKPEDYLENAQNQNGQPICNLLIYGNRFNQTEYLLGDIFMQNFYVILDYGSPSRFAINGHYVTVKELEEKGYRDPENKDPKNPTNPESGGGSVVWAVIGSIIGVLIVVAIVGFIIVRMKNRRLQANLAKYETL